MKDLNEIIADQQRVINSQLKQIAELTEKLDQFPAPALPEATVDTLRKAFVNSIDKNTSPNGHVFSVNCFDDFLPAIQEYVAGQKVAISLTDKAQAYYNEVAYSLDYGNGEVTTMEQVFSHCLEELADFENKFGESVTGWVEGIKEAEENSETPEKAKQYLQSHGVDTESLVSRGMEFIKQVKLNVEQKQIIASKDAEIKALEEQLEAKKTGLQWVNASERYPDGDLSDDKQQLRHAITKEVINPADIIAVMDDVIFHQSTEKKPLPLKMVEWLDETAAVPVPTISKTETVGLCFVEQSVSTPPDEDLHFIKCGNYYLVGYWNEADKRWYITSGSSIPKNHHQKVFWLDESAAVPDARQEAIDFTEWIINISDYFKNNGKFQIIGTWEVKPVEEVFNEFKDWQAKQKEVQNGKD